MLIATVKNCPNLSNEITPFLEENVNSKFVSWKFLRISYRLACADSLHKTARWYPFSENDRWVQQELPFPRDFICFYDRMSQIFTEPSVCPVPSSKPSGWNSIQIIGQGDEN